MDKWTSLKRLHSDSAPKTLLYEFKKLPPVWDESNLKWFLEQTEIHIDDSIPDGEIHFEQGRKIVGKIVNIGKAG